MCIPTCNTHQTTPQASPQVAALSFFSWIAFANLPVRYGFFWGGTNTSTRKTLTRERHTWLLEPANKTKSNTNCFRRWGRSSLYRCSAISSLNNCSEQLTVFPQSIESLHHWRYAQHEVTENSRRSRSHSNIASKRKLFTITK